MPLIKKEDEIRPKQDQQSPKPNHGTANLIHPTKQTGDDLQNPINSRQRNVMIAVPRYHERLYAKLHEHHEWLAETGGDPHIGVHWNKKVKTPEDLVILNKLIQDLRTIKSEIFIDFTFHRKPRNLPLRDYINEFLRVKGIFNYYTFTTWYRITVYPESGDKDCQELHKYKDKDGNEKTEPIRKEHFIIPLYIRLKKNKVYDQFKSIHYLNDSGTEYEVKTVNKLHFLRDDDSGSKDKDQKSKTKYEDNYTSKKLTRYDRLEQVDFDDEGEDGAETPQ
jgi:hypothetical protein